MFAKRGAEGKATKGAVPEKELGKLRRVDLLELLLDEMRANESNAAQVAELAELSERLKEKLDAKDAQLAHLKAKLDEKDLQIEHLKTRLDAKDARIAQLEADTKELSTTRIVMPRVWV